MTIYALTSLLSFVVALFLGVFIYFKDSKSIINRLYFIICLSISLYSFIEYGYRQSRSYEDAVLWWNFDILWSVHIACWVHLAVAFTERTKWLRSKLFYVLNYGPVAAFIILELAGHQITGPPVEQNWGWSYGVRENVLNTLSYIWIAIGPAFAAVLYITYYRQVSDPRRNRQAKLIMIGGLIPVGAQLAELFIGIWKLPFPPVVMFGFLLLNVIIGYAIWKYELFTLTPSKAAESIIATMGDALLLVGLDSTILTTNQATCRMLGYNEKELIGKSVRCLFAPDAPLPDWINDRHRSRVDTIHRSDMETEYIAANGRRIPVSLSGSMLNDDEGNIRGFLLIARDITERKKADEEIARHRDKLEELVAERTHQLSSTNTQLQQEIADRQKVETEKRELQEQLYQAQKMEAIGRLAGGVAHDFNNLLFVINGYAEALTEEVKGNDRAMEDLSQILEAGGRAVNLTRQLLAFSRKQIIDPTVVNINERIESSYKMLSRLLGEDIKINFSTTARSAKVVMDVTQLDQIIANLLVNARDAMPTGGSIHIRTANEFVPDTPANRLKDRKPGHYVLISVKDTGCGIASDKLEVIFEPFYTSKAVGKGTGLGLATVYGIIKQNQGFIEVDSVLGEGTEFKIHIPRSGAPGIDMLAQDTTVNPGGAETVLLVEDELLVRKLAKRQLEGSGYRVLEAQDALSALEVFEKHRNEIDVLLTDVVMPGMSGVEMAETLKRRAPMLKVLFMSGYNDEIIDQHGVRKAEYPLLAKPFTADQLGEKIRAVIDGTASVSTPFPAI